MAADLGITGSTGDAAWDAFAAMAKQLNATADEFSSASKVADTAHAAVVKAREAFRALPEGDIDFKYVDMEAEQTFEPLVLPPMRTKMRGRHALVYLALVCERGLAIGLWFFAFPIGFMSGSFISGRIGANRSIEFMTLLGGVIGVVNGILLIGWLYFGGVSMAALYIPGFFVSLAQGLSMPYAQAGAMAVDTELAGSASGAVVFSQFFWPAALRKSSTRTRSFSSRTLKFFGATLTGSCARAVPAASVTRARVTPVIAAAAALGYLIGNSSVKG